jgi:hypothetical protein
MKTDLDFQLARCKRSWETCEAMRELGQQLQQESQTLRLECAETCAWSRALQAESRHLHRRRIQNRAAQREKRETTHAESLSIQRRRGSSYLIDNPALLQT